MLRHQYRGGLSDVRAQAQKLTPEEQRGIADEAAKAPWNRNPE